MGQPLKSLFQNDLAKCPVEKEHDTDEFDAKFQELIRNVEHHVEEEESEMFPLAEQELAEDLDEMSEEMQELKADLQGS
jgi:hemerythrin-like domain-containing protein